MGCGTSTTNTTWVLPPKMWPSSTPSRARNRTNSLRRASKRPKQRKKSGKFKDEIVPVMIPQRKGDLIAFASDEFIKVGTTADALGSLKPAFNKEGTVTAGNASGINDGGAAVLVMSAQRAAQLGLKPLRGLRHSRRAVRIRRLGAWDGCPLPNGA